MRIYIDPCFLSVVQPTRAFEATSTGTEVTSRTSRLARPPLALPGGIANESTLNPIRPNNGEVGEPVLSEDVASVQEQEEIVEEITEGAGGADEVRAEADEEVRKRKPAARRHTPTRA